MHVCIWITSAVCSAFSEFEMRLSNCGWVSDFVFRVGGVDSRPMHTEVGGYHGDYLAERIDYGPLFCSLLQYAANL